MEEAAVAVRPRALRPALRLVLHLAEVVAVVVAVEEAAAVVAAAAQSLLTAAVAAAAVAAVVDAAEVEDAVVDAVAAEVEEVADAANKQDDGGQISFRPTADQSAMNTFNRRNEHCLRGLPNPNSNVKQTFYSTLLPSLTYLLIYSTKPLCCCTF